MAKILLVEDNELNRDMLARRLARRGYQVIVAVEGWQGMQLAQTEVPDLVLMDLCLPGMDGWEATRQLKALSGRALARATLGSSLAVSAFPRYVPV